MKLSEYIEGLKKFPEENGDMDAYYSRDDEGNGYQEVYWSGTKMYLEKESDNPHRPDLYCEDDLDYILDEYEIGSEDLISVCVVN